MTYDDWKADIRNEHGSAPEDETEVHITETPARRDGRMLIGTTHWWQDSGEIARLLRYLNDGLDGPLEMADAIYIVEKPWKWDAEYAEMCREQTEPGGIGEDDIQDMVR